ncbi:MAG: hypothetical protein EXR70_17250 [Deltaproteobacteria bacterium]|nr:hypothetical protein [Deltaproteobacteria bacterium]
MSTALLILEPTDDGIIEELSRKAIRDGEQRLMLAMLESATEDFQKYILATDRKGKELFLAAEEWILATDDPSFFSFECICEHLNFDPCYMRKGLMRWKEAKLDAQRKQASDSGEPAAADSDCLKMKA